MQHTCRSGDLFLASTLVRFIRPSLTDSSARCANTPLVPPLVHYAQVDPHLQVLPDRERHHPKAASNFRLWMECHVSTPKPLKKRDVRPSPPLVADMKDASSSSKSPIPVRDEGSTLPSSLHSSRRSSDSGVISPIRSSTEHPDSDSGVVEMAVPGSVRAPDAPPESQSFGNGRRTTAKRTPFCGRCRNHWPDKPVLVKGESCFCAPGLTVHSRRP